MKKFQKRKAHKPVFFVDMYSKAVSYNTRAEETAMSYQLERALQKKLDRMGFIPLEMKQTIELKAKSREARPKNKAVTLPPAFIASLQVPLGMLNVVHCG